MQQSPLGSRNFIKLVSIKVADLMLKHNVLDEITARLDSRLE
ncbi:hypothetical protein [Wolbachia pipientis]|nr:hypothetical protein [Wolbachia pipientis]